MRFLRVLQYFEFDIGFIDAYFLTFKNIQMQNLYLSSQTRKIKLIVVNLSCGLNRC